MSTQWIAVAGAALLIAGLAAPASGLDVSSSNVQQLKVRKIGKKCVRVSWAPPDVDNGDTYGIILRSHRGDEMYRVETFKTRATLCDLHTKRYHIRVKQYGAKRWVRAAVRMR